MESTLRVLVLLACELVAGCDGARSTTTAPTTPAPMPTPTGAAPADRQTSVPARARAVHAPDGMPPGSAGPPSTFVPESDASSAIGAR